MVKFHLPHQTASSKRMWIIPMLFATLLLVPSSVPDTWRELYGLNKWILKQNWYHVCLPILIFFAMQHTFNKSRQRYYNVFVKLVLNYILIGNFKVSKPWALWPNPKVFASLFFSSNVCHPSWTVGSEEIALGIHPHGECWNWGLQWRALYTS